jgi:site-specific recombinase
MSTSPSHHPGRTQPAGVDRTLPEAAQLVALLGVSGRPRCVVQLHAWFADAQLGGAPSAAEERLVKLGSWLRSGARPPLRGSQTAEESAPVARLRLLTDLVERVPGARLILVRVLKLALADVSAEALFARVGIPGDGGLLSETIDRLSRRLLPQPADERHLDDLLHRIFPRPAAWRWLRTVPGPVAERFIALTRTVESPAASTIDERDVPVGRVPTLPDPRASVTTNPTESVYLPLTVGLLEASMLLAARASAAGLSDVLRARVTPSPLRESPFFQLPRAIDVLFAASRIDAGEIERATLDVREVAARCRQALGEVLTQLDASGVSVDVVYRIELVERTLSRLDDLLAFVAPGSSEQRALRVFSMLAQLLDARARDRSLVDVIRTNTHFLARKVVERTGNTGEHYITSTPGEYVRMFLSAAGGGVVAACTNLVKILLGALHRPLLQEGLLIGANYAGSFILMQLLHFTLATKQPSMTASALAGALDQGEDLPKLSLTVARLVRSQVAAAAGNLCLVIPVSLLLDELWLRRTGAHILDEEYAHKTFAGHHPTDSPALLFACLTGVILWLSSLAAGWVENWAVYRRLPEAIREHRLGRIVGRRLMGWLSRFFERHVGGVGGNVAIGAMLGLSPALGTFAGLPVEIRHITISSSSVALAARTLGLEGPHGDALTSAVAGLGGVLACNLFVSFTLSFATALRARNVSTWSAVRLAWHVLVAFVRSPLRFLLPVGEGRSGPAVSPPHP